MLGVSTRRNLTDYLELHRLSQEGVDLDRALSIAVRLDAGISKPWVAYAIHGMRLEGTQEALQRFFTDLSERWAMESAPPAV